MKARVITTLLCNRKCDNCCNTYKSLLDQASPIKSISEVVDCTELLLTGGEPCLFPDKIIKLVNDFRQVNQTAKIFLYTAKYIKHLKKIIKLIDGVHYTLHFPLTPEDVNDFLDFQILIKHFNNKSFRCYIDSRVMEVIPIVPRLWTRLEIKPWLLEGECPLPKDEKLFILKED